MATRSPKPPPAPPPPGDDWQMTIPPPGGLPEVFEEEPEQTATDRVMQILSEVGADERAVVKVHRVPANGKEEWCEDYAPHDFESGGLRMIRDAWGPGVYSIRLYGVREGRFGILSRTQISLRESRLPVAANGAPSDATRLLMESQAAILRALTERPAAPDPKDSLKEMLGMMALMRDAFPPAAPAAPQKSSIAEIVEAIREMREASEIIAPGGDGKDESLTGMVKSMLPLISTAIANRGAAAPPAAYGPPLGAIGTGEPIGAANDTPPGDPLGQSEGELDMGALQDALMATRLRAYVFQLLTWARKDEGRIDGAHVENGAGLVADKMPDEWLDLLELDDWWLMFSAQVPEAVPYQAWFTAARDRAMVMLSDEGEETGADVRDSTPPPAIVKAVTSKAKKKP